MVGLRGQAAHSPAHHAGSCGLRGVIGRPGRQASDTARLAAIQSGAFLFDSAHSKFDASKDGLCKECRVPDTVEHRMVHCPLFAQARGSDAWVLEKRASLPLSLSHHLLPSASPGTQTLRTFLAALPDATDQFHSRKVASGRQHVFTDGACTLSESKGLALAGRGVISASTGEVLSCGPLHGLLQTAPRAELCAMISAGLSGSR